MKKSNTFQGLGTDIIEIDRIKKAIAKHGDRFLERLFTDQELAYCQRASNPMPHYAGRFAAKEAVLKAIGSDLEKITWKEIEILNDTEGKPEVHLSEKLKKNFPTAHFFITISHCREYATATAILVGTAYGS